MSNEQTGADKMSCPLPPAEWSQHQKRLYYLETLYTYCRSLALENASAELIQICREAITDLTNKLMALDGVSDEFDYDVLTSVGSNEKIYGKAHGIFEGMLEKLK